MLGAVLAAAVLAGKAQAAVWSFTNNNDTAWTKLPKANPCTSDFVVRLNEWVVMNRALPPTESARYCEFGQQQATNPIISCKTCLFYSWSSG